MEIVYFVHDVTDPAAARRLRMLRAAGANVSVIGFRRSDTVTTELEGAPVFDLGRTYDARMKDRALKVLEWMAEGQRFRDHVRGADIFLARNLEMLGIASAARRLPARRPPLVYECLDIHRLMLADSAPGRVLRLAERRLLAECALVMVSSPAFLSDYFQSMQGLSRLGVRTLLVENKLLDLERGGVAPPPLRSRRPGPPWRIGWFGILRCRKSLNILTALAARRPDLVEVIIRGRPTAAVFQDFDAAVDGVPALQFGGPYPPAEIGELYRGCHFSWAIDYYDEGLNSAMLIPNRIYESGAHRSVPLALAQVETGRWLARHGLGVRFDDPLREMEAFFETLGAAAYARLEATIARADARLFRADLTECQRIVSALAAVLAKSSTRDEYPSDPEILRPSAYRHSLPQRGDEPAGLAG